MAAPSSRGGLYCTREEARGLPASALAAVPSAELLGSAPPCCSHLEIRGFVVVVIVVFLRGSSGSSEASTLTPALPPWWQTASVLQAAAQA